MKDFRYKLIIYFTFCILFIIFSCSKRETIEDDLKYLNQSGNGFYINFNKEIAKKRERISKITNYIRFMPKAIELDKDGTLEHIEMRAFTNSKFATKYLFINNTILAPIFWGNRYEIIDIDTNDNYLEVKVPLVLPNNNYKSEFFTVFGNKIVEMGTIPGIISKKGTTFVYNGSGFIFKRISGKLLVHNLYVKAYRINEEHIIEKLPQKDVYEILDLKVKLKRDLPVYKLKDLFKEKVKPLYIFKKGTEVILKATDNKKWFLIENNNKKGYIGVTNFYIVSGINKSAPLIFDGLYKCKKIDLDGDGKNEEIYFIEKETYGGASFLDVIINDIIVGTFWNPEIVDIDKNDKYKEIKATLSAPFDEIEYGIIEVGFFYYDSKSNKLVEMGKFDNFNKIVIKNGKVGVLKGSNIIPFTYMRYYRIDSRHLLKKIPTKLMKVNKKVILNDYIWLRKSKKDKGYYKVLKPGQVITILKSDDEKWCLIKSKDGDVGWFKIGENYNWNLSMPKIFEEY